MRIVEYPHPALLAPTVPVLSVDRALKRQVGEMFEAMYDARGVGLAANQVAIPHRLCIMNLDTENHSKDEESVYLNPTIVSSKGHLEEEEGCLSFPGLYAKVRRASEIVVEAYDLKGKKVRIEADGFLARAWQHELDHLDGKVFIDRFAAVTKLAKRGSIKEFEERFQRAQKEGRIPPTAEIQRTLANLRQAAAD